MDAPTTTVSAGRSGDNGSDEGIAPPEPSPDDLRTPPAEAARRQTTQRSGSMGGEQRVGEERTQRSMDYPPRFYPVHPAEGRGSQPPDTAVPALDHRSHPTKPMSAPVSVDSSAQSTGMPFGEAAGAGAGTGDGAYVPVEHSAHPHRDPDRGDTPAREELPWPREAVSPLGTPTRLRLPGQHQALAIEQGPVAEPSRPTMSPASTSEVPSDAELVRRTLAEIEPTADRVTSYFYALLFLGHPELRPLFPVAMDTQRDRLLKALLTAAEHMDDPVVLTEYLQHLGRGHRKYGTQAAHYPAVGEALLGALSRYATRTWGPETEAAWVRTYTTISQIMIDAAAENEVQAPAWWHAEVVSHDLRTPDIAVVTVRPDQPYPFVAGQYTSVETPWWPRVWRHYSFASAPRPDGLLSFHVKAVPAGWVSGALVRHARPGDILRLGPPAGSMTVDHSTDNGLLCLGGGTGIAPIKALVEDVAQHGTRRPVEVFYGARTDFDLYDIDTMLRLQKTHPWLSVRPVVDDRAHFPDAVRAFGPWHEYDGYLSGPPGMIRSGVHALRGIGIPPNRIRHDSFEDLITVGS
ncbi:globin domain-containing protein [Streptomyces sp. NPDC059076]|uniref:globin domain-containing protein n=1 Tax=unclassified Streptomyces TaxID=2593676 RepID=UPI003697D630